MIKSRFFSQCYNIFMLSVILMVATGCNREEDDFILQPTENSIIISGRVATPEGVALSDIDVAVDYEFRSLLGTIVKHKAKGKTDNKGYYKIFFEVGEDEVDSAQDVYIYSVDFSSLDSEKYLIPDDSRLNFYMGVNNKEGKTLECNFTVPRKKYVEVRVNNDGVPLESGEYAVKNVFVFGSNWQSLSSMYENYNSLTLFETVEIPQNGSSTMRLPCAVGVPNCIGVVYRGTPDYYHVTGRPASEVKEITVTADLDEEIVLEYVKPEI